MDLEQLVRIAPTELRVLHHLGQFLVQRLEPHRPIDLGGGIGEEEGHEIRKIVLQDLLPRAVVVIGHRVASASYPDTRL